MTESYTMVCLDCETFHTIQSGTRECLSCGGRMISVDEPDTVFWDIFYGHFDHEERVEAMMNIIEHYEKHTMSNMMTASGYINGEFWGLQTIVSQLQAEISEVEDFEE